MQAWQAAVKRLIDVVLGVVALVLVLPVMALVALAVTLDSSGPIVYGARRVGRNGREFTMWKFRSMARGADRVGPAVTGSYDYRVTRVGAVLRRTKLDELPQLLNVDRRADVAGRAATGGAASTSSSGPTRSARCFACARASPDRASSRISTRRSGWSATPTRSTQRELMHAKLALDLDYVRHYSLRRDIGLLWKTFAGILARGRAPVEPPSAPIHAGRTPGVARAGAPMLLDAALAGARSGAGGRAAHRPQQPVRGRRDVLDLRAAGGHRPSGGLPARRRLPARVALPDRVGRGARGLVAGGGVRCHGPCHLRGRAAVRSSPAPSGFPRSALIIEFILSVLVLGGIRFASRVRQEGLRWRGGRCSPDRPVRCSSTARARPARMLVREMRRNRRAAAGAGCLPGRRRRASAASASMASRWPGPATTCHASSRSARSSEVIVALPRMSAATGCAESSRCAKPPAWPSARSPASRSCSTRASPSTRSARSASRTCCAASRMPFRMSRCAAWSLAGPCWSPAREAASGQRCAGRSRRWARAASCCYERAETPLFFIDEELRRRFPDVEIVAVLG